MIFQHGCCCFDDLKEAAKASSYFTGVTAIVNLIINIWVLVTLHRLEDYLEDNEEWNFIPPGYLALMYIELLFNLCFLGVAFVLMIGINRGFQGRVWMFSWVWVVSILRVYEIFFGMYLLIWLGGHRIPDVVFVCPQFLFVVAYWGLGTFILVFAILGVLSYWQEIVNDLYGKEKRILYLKRLLNIRQVAQQRTTSMFSGTATPRSLLMSQSTLGHGYSQPQSVSSYPVKQPRSHLPSTASAMSYHSVASAGPPRGGGGGGYPPPNRGPPSTSGGYPPPNRGYPSTGGGGYPPQSRGPPSIGGASHQPMPRLPEQGYRAGQQQI